MNDYTIQLVRESFDLVEPIAPRAAALFYTKLFDLEPSARTLFRGDLEAQGERLMRALAHTVATLDRPDVLVPTLQDLAARHSGYGVLDDHYGSVGVALIETLRAGLGVAFTDEVEAAWLDVYATAASTMRRAADPIN